jgi:hypothetical protein
MHVYVPPKVHALRQGLHTNSTLQAAQIRRQGFAERSRVALDGDVLR